MSRQAIRHSLTLITASLVLLIALLAGGSLFLLHRFHNQLAHTTAARSVMATGRNMAADLARQPILQQGSTEADWREFSRLIQSLHTVEQDLQFVSVTVDGVTVFQEHTTALDGRGDTEATVRPESVVMGRRVLGVGPDGLPVVSFVVEVKGLDGRSRVLEIGLRREAVDREEKAAAEAIRSMFILSLLTVLVSFGICVLLVVWMMQREMRREQFRRQEEHLAFSGVLANGIVHDFRNPMSSLRLDIQMLGKEAAKGESGNRERIGQLAERVRNTLDRMDKVFQEFLFLSRPADEAPETVEVKTCLRECLELIAPRLEHAGVRAELTAPEQPLFVKVASSAFRRALINILVNAEQFSPRGEAISVRVASEEGRAIIDICDRGPGIPRENRKKLFAMFFSTRPQGTGLGLFMAKAALERNGGQIKALDRSGGGACFRVSVPLAEEKKG